MSRSCMFSRAAVVGAIDGVPIEMHPSRHILDRHGATQTANLHGEPPSFDMNQTRQDLGRARVALSGIGYNLPESKPPLDNQLKLFD